MRIVVQPCVDYEGSNEKVFCDLGGTIFFTVSGFFVVHSNSNQFYRDWINVWTKLSVSSQMQEPTYECICCSNE